MYIMCDRISVVNVAIGCRPPPAVDCAINVVSEQCGEEIASYLRTLGSKVLGEMECTKFKRK